VTPNDPIKDAFDSWSGQRIDPSAARAEYATMLPGLHRARRVRRFRQGVAAAFALTVGVASPSVIASMGNSPAVNLIESADGGSIDAPPAPDEPEVVETAPTVELAQIDNAATTESPDEMIEPVEPVEPVEAAAPVNAGTGQSVDPSTAPVEPNDGSSHSDDTSDDHNNLGPGPHTVVTPGGSMTVELAADGTITLIDYTVADGFEADVDQEADDVDIVFSNGDETYEVEASISDGQLEIEKDPHS